MKAIPTVAVVMLRGRNDDEVLLVKHGEASRHPMGTYGLPAGRIESGEKEISAAVRELFEETALKVDWQSLMRRPRIFHAWLARKNSKRKFFSMRVFVCHYNQLAMGVPQKSNETEPVWVKIADLGKYNPIPNVAEAINHATHLTEKEIREIEKFVPDVSFSDE